MHTGRAIEIGHFHTFQTFVTITLTLYRGIRHTVMFTDRLYLQTKFCSNWKTFL